ncbi:hypothetical protein HMPREF9071_1524 [Capnocytophaga sp. oral taxon 338 str. F0234]|nr:hypothetical protein HMPREF9071_1524 [Capnocytophaga sp. oral taxon 338 str. F0234]
MRKNIDIKRNKYFLIIGFDKYFAKIHLFIEVEISIKILFICNLSEKFNVKKIVSFSKNYYLCKWFRIL